MVFCKQKSKKKCIFQGEYKLSLVEVNCKSCCLNPQVPAFFTHYPLMGDAPEIAIGDVFMVKFILKLPPRSRGSYQLKILDTNSAVRARCLYLFINQISRLKKLEHATEQMRSHDPICTFTLSFSLTFGIVPMVQIRHTATYY